MVKFKVILPTIGRKSLGRAIESVLGQAFGAFDLLIVGGQDFRRADSPKDPRIRYIWAPIMSNKNDSGTYNRRFGINRVEEGRDTQYITYIDDDDIWLPNHLETFASHIEKTGSHLIRTTGLPIKTGKRKSPRHKRDPLRYKVVNADFIKDPMCVGFCHSLDIYLQTPGWQSEEMPHDHVLWREMEKAQGKPGDVLPFPTFLFEL